MKLSQEDLKSIRQMYADKKLNQVQLAERFGVTQAHISRIVNSKVERTTPEMDPAMMMRVWLYHTKYHHTLAETAGKYGLSYYKVRTIITAMKIVIADRRKHRAQVVASNKGWR